MTELARVPLNELVTPIDRFENVDPEKEYRLLGMRSNIGGPFIREVKTGMELSASKLNQVRSGDFIYSRLFAWQGSFGAIPDEMDGCYVSNEFPIFRINQKKVTLDYLVYWFGLPSTQKIVEADCSGSTPGTRNRYKEEFFLNLRLPIVALEQQHCAVRKIRTARASIRKAKELRGLVDSAIGVLPRAELSHTFDYRPGDALPDGWRWYSLPELLADEKEGIATGPFGTLLQKSEIVSEGVPVFGIKNVAADEFIPGFSDFVTEAKAHQLNRYCLRPGDIVVARSGTVGRSCLVPSNLQPAPIMSTNLLRLRLNSLLMPEMLSRLFNGSVLVERHKAAECRGSTRAFFTQKILKKLLIPTPPESEQTQILERLVGLQRKLKATSQVSHSSSGDLDRLFLAILDRAYKAEL